MLMGKCLARPLYYGRMGLWGYSLHQSMIINILSKVFGSIEDISPSRLLDERWMRPSRNPSWSFSPILSRRYLRTTESWEKLCVVIVVTCIDLWLSWYWRMASHRFQKEYSGQRTDWKTRQEWEVWKTDTERQKNGLET